MTDYDGGYQLQSASETPLPENFVSSGLLSVPTGYNYERGLEYLVRSHIELLATVGLLPINPEDEQLVEDYIRSRRSQATVKPLVRRVIGR